jgi:hypothetical protein
MCRELRAASDSATHRQLESLQTDNRSFWRAFDVVRRSKVGECEVPPAIKCSDGSVITEAREWLHAWKAHFAELGVPNRPTTDTSRQFAEHLRTVLLRADPDLNAKARGELECPITPEELTHHLSRLKRGKAVGHDQMPAEVFKIQSESLVRALCEVFNHLMEQVVWPTDWWYGVIVPIAKPGGDKFLPSEYRGITLLPVLSKLFESVINERVAAFLERTHALSDLQGGFRADRSTLDQLFVVNECVAEYRERKQPLYIAFLDVAKAYDKCWRDGLADRMAQCGLTQRIIQLFRASQAHVQRAVVVRGQTTERIPFDTGVPQGAVTSPMLYAMFIDGLARELESSGCGALIAGERVPGLLYADDIALLASSPAELQRALDIASAYAERMQFTYNLRKCNVVVVGDRAAQRAAQGTGFVLAGGAIALSDAYKYLGVWMGHAGRAGTGARKWEPTLSALHQRALGAERMIHSVGGGKRGVSPSVHIKLWKACALPCLEYACAIWGPELMVAQRKHLDTHQTKFLRRVLHCGVDTANAFITGESGLRAISNHCDELALRYFGRLCTLDTNTRMLGRVFQARLSLARAAAAADAPAVSSSSSPSSLPPPLSPSSHASSSSSLPSPPPLSLSSLSRAAAPPSFAPAAPPAATRARSSARTHTGGWCYAMRKVFRRHGLEHYWTGATPVPAYEKWRKVCREATLAHSNAVWAREVRKCSTLRPLYAQLKAYPWVDPSLFDGSNSEGRWLKLKVRSGTLPLNRRAADLTRSQYMHACKRKHTPPDVSALQAIERTTTCTACASGAVEDAQHFVFRCDASVYADLEGILVRRLRALHADHTVYRYQRMTEFDRLRVLLGCTFDTPYDARNGSDRTLRYELSKTAVVTAIDKTVKNFLLVRWRDRTARVGGEACTVAHGDSFSVITSLAAQAHRGGG